MAAKEQRLADANQIDEKPRRALRLTIAYDGTNFFGWQRQPKHRSVQQVVEECLGKTFGTPPVHVLASSRTDTGVHALGQSAVCWTNCWNAAADKLPLAMNIHMPPDVVIRQAEDVPVDFHPLRLSKGKRYRYFVYCSRKADPINARTHWWVRQRVSFERMQEASKLFVGKFDFQSFQTSGSPRSSTVRTIRELTVSKTPHLDGCLFTFDIEADGFLYNMVRNIVGTLVQVGVGRKGPEWIQDVLAAKDRREAGQTAPPQGLFLMEVLF